MRCTLAATGYVPTLLEPWIARLMTSAPGLDIALVAADAERQVVRMERGEIDLAILNLQRPPAGPRSRRVLVERLVVIGRRVHRALKHKLALDTFCALAQVLVSPRGASFSGPANEAVAAIGGERRVRRSVSGFAPAVKLVTAANLDAVFPERLARRAAPRLKIGAPPLALADFAMVAAWHERAQRDPAHQWSRDAVHAALADGSPGDRRRKLGAP
jgi:DNA-binding transcriptional LysR family regulator